MSFRNAEGFVEDAIKSILSQTFADFELILTDDCSTDGSRDIAQRYTSDPRVKYFKNTERLGKPKTLNRGLAAAKADLVAIMDGDDISETDRLAVQYKFMNDHPEITLAGTFVEIIDAGNRVIDRVEKPLESKTIKKVSFIYSPFTHGSVIFRKQAIIDIGGYREEYQYCQDIDLFLRVIHSDFKTANIPLYLYRYRRHAKNTRHYRASYLNAFKIKRRAKKEFSLKLSAMETCSLYGHLVLDAVFTSEQKRVIESAIKRIVLRSA